MKHTANIITICRIFLSLSLLIFLDNKAVFMSVYLICGISDVLDGAIARRTRTESRAGARLDSAADIVMFGIITASFIVWVGPELKSVLPYVAAVALLRIAGLLIAAYKYRCFAMLHTWANKASGVLVFITPVLYAITGEVWIIPVVSIICALSAVEECAIHIISDELDLNRRSIFYAQRR
ncbi:CDP-alcohol phosphatidyltransferase family protein [Anaerobacterium chartisolvens]|nr:CDP-alcohol phosphatidyltransferase family protein [Anaerobacterium chartisolvens]